MTNIRNDIAEYIRLVDGNNQLGPAQLSASIAAHLRQQGLVDEATENAIDDFAYEANRGGSGYLQPKRLGAGALADAIVDHFGLDKEN